ncbi:MAG TPA: hypothetical protein VGA49_01130 [Patescibacteria group bacterium]
MSVETKTFKIIKSGLFQSREARLDKFFALPRFAKQGGGGNPEDLKVVWRQMDIIKKIKRKMVRSRSLFL